MLQGRAGYVATSCSKAFSYTCFSLIPRPLPGGGGGGGGGVGG